MNKNDLIFKQAVENFQCKGCVNGEDTGCGFFGKAASSHACTNHTAGTISSLQGILYLGMPTGFNQVGFSTEYGLNNNIRIFDKADVAKSYNVFNLPVWYQEIDDNLFVRTFLPRRGTSHIDIFIGGKAKDIHIASQGADIGEIVSNAASFNPIDIAPFCKNID
jgi:hypothetical protein